MPVWHASVSLNIAGRGVDLDRLRPAQRRRVEKAAKALLAGVGDGPRRWEHGELPHVLHVRRRLSDAEVAALPIGPPPVDRAGGSRLYGPQTCAP